MIEAGSLPRSLTVRPFFLAQDRTSALPGDPFMRSTGCCLGPFVFLAELIAAVRLFCDADCTFRAFSFFGAALPVAAFVTAFDRARCPREPDKSTLYIAPTTRNASARGSFESRVIFTVVAFRKGRTARQPPAAKKGNAIAKLYRPRRDCEYGYGRRWFERWPDPQVGNCRGTGREAPREETGSRIRAAM